MDRRTVLKGAGGAVVTSFLSGCLGGGDPSSDASIWHELSESRARSVETMVSEYESDVGVELAFEERRGLESQIDTGIETETAPELYAWTNDWVGDHWERGFLADGSEYVTVDVDETFNPVAAEAVHPPNGDEIIGLPRGGEVPTILYNREYIDDPPTSVDGLVDAAADFHDSNDGTYGFTSRIDSYFLSMWLQAFDGFVFRLDDGEPELGIERDAFHEGVEFYRDQLYELQLPDPSYDDQTDAFASGNALFHVNGPWAVPDLRNVDAVDLGVAPVPDIEGGQLTPYSLVDLWYFTKGIDDESRGSIAVEFAEWYATSASVAERMAEDHFAIPVRSDVDLDEYPEAIGAFTQTFDQGALLPSHPAIDAVWDPLDDAIGDILADGADIEDRLSDAADEIRGEWD